MNFFNRASDFLPEHWEKLNYTSDTYFLVDLSEDNNEYIEIKNFCTNKIDGNIKAIKRIQHPFAYLRYKLREEFKRLWGESCNLGDREIEPVATENLNDYIKYNCDNRRKRPCSQPKNYVIRRYVTDSPVRDNNLYPEYVVEVD